MIISGGMNVYPAEVEKCISDFPQVAQAAVIGLPDSKWGEMVAVAVVPKIGETIDEEELIEYSRKTLSGYKVPRKIIFVDALPIGPTGKVIKRELKVQLIK
jgi:acyl-CoA synthetase (AMP-forming)/AMP-acid ligase II